MNVMDGSPAFRDSLLPSEPLEPARFCPDTRDKPEDAGRERGLALYNDPAPPGSGVGQGHLGHVA